MAQVTVEIILGSFLKCKEHPLKNRLYTDHHNETGRPFEKLTVANWPLLVKDTEALLTKFVKIFPITNKIKPVHTLPSKIQLNITHPYTLSSLKYFLLQASSNFSTSFTSILFGPHVINSTTLHSCNPLV
jgi:hypothetical protein